MNNPLKKLILLVTSFYLFTTLCAQTGEEARERAIKIAERIVASTTYDFVNKKTGETRPDGFDIKAHEFQEFAFGGVHIISPSIFDSLENYSKEPKFSITPFYIDKCKELNIQGYNPDGYEWFDIGKPETLTLATEYFRQQKK